MGISEQSTLLCEQKLLTSRQIFQYAVPARTVTKKHCQYQFEIFTSYLLKFSLQLRHAYVMNKKLNTLFTESIYSCFQVCKSY